MFPAEAYVQQLGVRRHAQSQHMKGNVPPSLGAPAKNRLRRYHRRGAMLPPLWECWAAPSIL
eukprot:6773693-Prorocentrum_lima.AAC.1